MYDRLQRYYAHAISDNHLHDANRLSLHLSENRELILDKTKLTEEEIVLLKTLFDGKEIQLVPEDSQDRLIYEWLIDEKQIDIGEIEKIISTPVRFIHLHINGELPEREEFAEAVQGLFPSAKTLLWKTIKEAVIIQQINSEFDEDLSVQSIIDTITADFFVKVSLYIGSPILACADIFERYEWETTLFSNVIKSFPRKSFFIEQDITNYFLLHNLPPSSLQMMNKMIKPVMNDKTLLESVKTYLECNMNASLAAKKLYMHRNTLQYRVDKFIEKTSIDIKQFPNAVAVYLMLVSFES
ncbi:hypothetical protein CR194_00695 [Salipaludibacillus keqinensis]|uniref:PucR C-terminal helix-turn-helix domain-containing protein n=1 Tax=Salipaludibacillus keqinensis TaxID=2045207 RepID=A0A323TMZ6_9BACI|nr:helix-turn-helix domain-containing protein [Salipaludibacillus keqinensis]PYZ94093.1 hypothetical protein CR194_00695 [Salipaludibacillus keqinensis]